jgi:hypothetical protein
MELTACALELPRDHFASAFEAPSELNRLHAAYSPAGATAERGGEDAGGGPAVALRRGEHTDFEALTILWHEGSGLQVRAPGSGRWVDVRPVPGALTVNAGDLLQLWSNDVLRTCAHRVANDETPPGSTAAAAVGQEQPAGGVRDGGRLSLVMFTGPSPRTLVEALATCVGAGRPARYAPIVAAEHVRRKIRATESVRPVSAPAAGSPPPPAGAAAAACRRLGSQLRGLGRGFPAAIASRVAAEIDPHPGPAASNEEVLAAHRARVAPRRRAVLDAAVLQAITAWPGGCG